MCSGVSLQVERVVEAFPTERAEKALDFFVSLEVPLEMFGRVKGQVTHGTGEITAQLTW